MRLIEGPSPKPSLDDEFTMVLTRRELIAIGLLSHYHEHGRVQGVKNGSALSSALPTEIQGRVSEIIRDCGVWDEAVVSL